MKGSKQLAGNVEIPQSADHRQHADSLSPRELGLIRSCVNPLVSAEAVRPDWLAVLTRHIKSATTADRLLRKSEGCAMLGLSRPTFDMYVRLGNLKSVRFGANVRFKQSEIERFLNEGVPASDEHVEAVRAKTRKAAAASVASRRAAKLAREA